MSPQPAFDTGIDEFSGMDYSLDGQTSDPSKLWLIENLLPWNGSLYRRPRFTKWNTGISATTQWFGRFDSVTGPTLIFVGGGQIYNGGTGTLLVTTANFATAGITINTSGAIYTAALNNKLIVSDGTNTPFQWDGTAGAGGLTSLTNCPVFYGAPVVYYAKLFGIKNTDRRKITWSEENDPTTGYETGGFNNVWALTQTDELPLFSLCATNEALYYYRRSAIGAIRGAVTPDFTTMGVHDAISAEIGTSNRRCPVLIGTDQWFVDATGLPWVLSSTGALVPLARRVERCWYRNFNATSPPYYGDQTTLAVGEIAPTFVEFQSPIVLDSVTDTVIVWGNGAGGTAAHTAMGIVFRRTDYAPLAFYTIPLAAGFGGATSILAGAVSQNNLVSVCTISGGIAQLGQFLPASTGTVTGDDLAGTATNPSMRFVTGQLVHDSRMAYYFEELTVECRRDTTDISGFGLQYLTSQVNTIAGMATPVAVVPTVQKLENQTIGIAGYGRWIAIVGTVTSTVTTISAHLQIGKLRLKGYVDAEDNSIT